MPSFQLASYKLGDTNFNYFKVQVLLLKLVIEQPPEIHKYIATVFNTILYL